MTSSAQPYTLMVADIHLQPDPQDPINQTFIQFLNTQARHANALYILGDLFEMWVGDDIGLTQYQTEIAALKHLSDSGVALYALYGNRDFLMRDAFWQATGITPIDDVSLVKIYGLSVLLSHGDVLCREDKGYQRLRWLLRCSWIQTIFLNLSKKRRIAIGERLRQGSQTASQQKPMRYMDVSDSAVTALFQKHPECNHLIHGHTHQPAHHQLKLGHQTKHRWVVGDWRPQAQILKLQRDHTLTLIPFPADSPPH